MYPETFLELACLAKEIHAQNARWWRDPATHRPLERNVGELLMLATSELAEAMEGHRKDLMDTHLPHRKMFEVELADALIRILDMSEGLGCDIAGAVREKLEYNQRRADHTDAVRLAKGGKKY